MRDELSAELYPSAKPLSADSMRSMSSAVSIRDIVSNVMLEFPLSRLETYQPLPSSCNLFLKKSKILYFFLQFRRIMYIFTSKVWFIGLMELSDVLKSRRKTLEISQLDLAEMAGVGLATVKDIERKKGNPSMSTVLKILEVLGMEIVFQVRQTV